MISANNPATGTNAPLLRIRWLAVSTFCTLSIALFVTLAAGCGPSERQRVQTVSDRFMEAMLQEDWDRAKPLLTEKARDAMGRINPFSNDEEFASDSPSPPVKSSSARDYTIGEPIIEEASAAVPVTLTDAGDVKVGTLRLRREDGEWRVRALRIEGENKAPGMTLDFENPEAALLEATFRAVGEGVGEMLKGVGKGMGAFLRGFEQ
ncbi:MAG: hypothetical protein V4671_32540, partial [Armatimonadota bacterium]